MGVGRRQSQGLWITTRSVRYTARRLVRVSEVAVIADFGRTPFPVAVVIRQYGLKIGMQYRRSHDVGVTTSDGSIEFTAAPAGADPALLTWYRLNQDTGTNSVTTLVKNVFGSTGNWKGYRIVGNQIPRHDGPNGWAPEEDRLFFRITVRNFTPAHAKDVHVVPMVCVLDSVPDFVQHYVLGVGAFTVGHAANGLQFDSEVMTYDVPTPPSKT